MILLTVHEFMRLSPKGERPVRFTEKYNGMVSARPLGQAIEALAAYQKAHNIRYRDATGLEMRVVAASTIDNLTDEQIIAAGLKNIDTLTVSVPI